MTVRRTAAVVGAVAVAPLALSLLTAAPAAAHGSMEDPVSRVRACFHEGPESPSSAACREMVAIGGTQPLYDWNEVNIADADGRHRDLIPDGELCSAGRDKYAGLDQARADWQTTGMSAGSHTFRYTATAPHTGSFELYITQAGYDPAQPLSWSDLQHFGEVTDPPLENGQYVFDLEVPEREGRHLIYSVWQRSDSPEAFYTCSDVVFGGGGSGGAGGGGAATAPGGGQADGTGGGTDQTDGATPPKDHGHDAHDAHEGHKAPAGDDTPAEEPGTAADDHAGHRPA
ncbi:lytic polysaccharide monooxygenase, partial [Streptomyces sp. SM14]